MTRVPAPVQPPVALTIAGSDSGGGAGIQADLKTMEAHDVFGTSVITSVTAQNTRGVESSFVLPTEEIAAQFDAVSSDFEIGAAKTGMLATAEVVRLVVDCARDIDAPVVVDPVMVAASGDRLLEPAAETAYASLVEAATVVTPNADEATVLTETEVIDRETARAAGEELVAMGAETALVKGGHLDGERVVDTVVTEDGVHTFDHPWIATEATHGSGCTLSSAIAARLARGEELVPAIEAATAFMERAVRYHIDVGNGPGAVNHLVALRERADRHPTAEAVERIVAAVVDADAAALVPEVGMNVVGATSFAESTDEIAAVDGRITRTLSGIHPNRGVRFGASSHVARFLLTCRERAPDLRFAANCRFDTDVETALEALEWTAVELDRGAEPESSRTAEGGTMGWAASRAFDQAGETPTAVFDRGDVGKEPVVRVLAPDEETMASRLLALQSAIDTARD